MKIVVEGGDRLDVRKHGVHLFTYKHPRKSDTIVVTSTEELYALNV